MLKGGNKMFEPIVIGMIEQTKSALLQTNPQLSKDLDAVSQQLRTEYSPRTSSWWTRRRSNTPRASATPS